MLLYALWIKEKKNSYHYKRMFYFEKIMVIILFKDEYRLKLFLNINSL